MKIASQRVVSMPDRAENPLRAHFLTLLRHFSRHFVFFYGATP
jgi:hypothetical protein